MPLKPLTKEEKARQLRYKRPMLADFGYYTIMQLLDEIEEDAYDVHWWCDSDDGMETLTNALDGNDEEAYEFKMAFADLESKCSMLRDALSEHWDIKDYFDDCTTALIGKRYEVVGYDGLQEDYFSLTRFEQDLATTEAGKRCMRWNKAEMLSKIGQCMGIILAVVDIKEQHEKLSTTLEMLKGENTGILKTIKEIQKLYDELAENDFSPYCGANKRFDMLVDSLPDRMFVE